MLGTACRAWRTRSYWGLHHAFVLRMPSVVLGGRVGPSPILRGPRSSRTCWTHRCCQPKPRDFATSGPGPAAGHVFASMDGAESRSRTDTARCSARSRACRREQRDMCSSRGREGSYEMTGPLRGLVPRVPEPERRQSSPPPNRIARLHKAKGANKARGSAQSSSVQGTPQPQTSRRGWMRQKKVRGCWCRGRRRRRRRIPLLRCLLASFLFFFSRFSSWCCVATCNAQIQGALVGDR